MAPERYGKRCAGTAPEGSCKYGVEVEDVQSDANNDVAAGWLRKKAHNAQGVCKLKIGALETNLLFW